MTPAHRHVFLAALLIAGAALLAWTNSLSAPFVFDDLPGIVTNESIRDLRAPATVLAPPAEAAGACGRPVVNLSLALNYAVGGTDVRGYHATNLALHVCAALALFGLVRRTLLQPALAARYGAVATPLGAAVAALWAVHPLQTESVTCVIQRSEILGGLFYLLTLYCFARALGIADAGGSRGKQIDYDRFLTAAAARNFWFALSFLACLLGMASKEFVASAPLLAWLYDRTFVAGSFGAAWRARWRPYLALAATWLLLGYVMLGSPGRGGTVGFATGLPAWNYALTQCRALVLYLRLGLWPHPLVVDYGRPVEPALLGVLPHALLLVGLFAATLVALRRRAALGFVGAVFFAVLGPSSSFVPLATQTLAEHRMYLPLAAVLVPLVLGAQAVLGRRAVAAFVCLGLVLGALTSRRNLDYRSAVALWTDTVARRPENPRARVHLGDALAAAERVPEAAAAYRAALRLDPQMAEAMINLGDLLAANDRAPEALPFLETALRLRPASAEAHVTFGAALDRVGRADEALREYERALRLQPRLAGTRRNLADAFLRRGRPAVALEHLAVAQQLEPDSADTHYKLAVALAASGRMAEARAAFVTAQRLQPADSNARHNWANALVAAGLPAEALEHYEQVVRRRPDFADAHYNWGNALSALERYDDAARRYTEALRVNPDFAPTHTNLGNALLMLQRDAEALGHYERALQLNPTSASAHNNLGLALARLGRLAEAVTHFEAAVKLAPEYRDARDNLIRARAELLLPP